MTKRIARNTTPTSKTAKKQIPATEGITLTANHKDPKPSNQPHGSAPFIRDAHLSSPESNCALDELLRSIRTLRDDVLANPAKATPELLAQVMGFQRPDGSFSLTSDYHMDSDCRVAYVYRPSYACCQILTAVLLAGSTAPGLEDALKTGLTFCTGRQLKGHGYDDMKDQLEDMADFARAGIPRLMAQNHPCVADSPFLTMITNILDSYDERLSLAYTFGAWGEDYTLPIMDVVDQFGLKAHATVFVYGTLMEGMPNSGLLAGCPYEGRGIIEGFSLYDLGPFPAIKPVANPIKPKRGQDPEPLRGLNHQVMGELRRVDADHLRMLHRLEGKGELYDFERVDVQMSGMGTIGAYVYVYRGEVDPQARIPLQLQPYPKLRTMKSTHVWYVCYGSNLLRERFMAYVKGGRCRHNGRTYPGCTDATPPVDERVVTLPYELYFGNESSSWGNSGAAFLDASAPGTTQGRAYLITRDQYQQIHMMEGCGSTWYDQEIELGSLSGIPMVTFTNSGRRPANPPSRAYLEVMRLGLDEILPGFETDEYLTELAMRAKR